MTAFETDIGFYCLVIFTHNIKLYIPNDCVLLWLRKKAENSIRNKLKLQKCWTITVIMNKYRTDTHTIHIKLKSNAQSKQSNDHYVFTIRLWLVVGWLTKSTLYSRCFIIAHFSYNRCNLSSFEFSVYHRRCRSTKAQTLLLTMILLTIRPFIF